MGARRVGVSPYVSVFRLVGCSGELGGVPGSGVDVEGGEYPGLEWVAAGDETDDLVSGPFALTRDSLNPPSSEEVYR